MARSTRSRNQARSHHRLPLQRIAGWAALGLILVVPLLWDTGAAEMFRGPKREAALVLWVILAALFLAVNTPGRSCWDRWWAPWAGVLAAGLVSAAAGSDPVHSLFSLLPLVLAALGWGAIRQFPSAWRERLAAAVVVSGVIQATVALLFLLPAAQPGSWQYLEELSGRYLWLGTMGNPGDVAVFLVLPALLAISLSLTGRPPRWWLLGAGVFQGAVILATATMTAVAALAAGLLVLLVKLAPAHRRLAVWAAGVAAVVILALVTPVRSRLESEIRTVQHAGWSAAGSYRAASYAAGAAMLASHPVTGVGFGRFEAHSFQFQREEVRAERARTIGMRTGFGEAHNDILQFVAETGLLGLALACAGLAFAVRRRDGHGILPHPIPLVAAAIVLALTQFPLHLTAIAAQWAVLAALASPALPPPPPFQTWGRRLRVILVLALTAATAWVAWQRHTAWRGIKQGDVLAQVLRDAPSAEARREVARIAMVNLEPRLRWLPGAWEPRVTMGNLAINAGDPWRARDHFSRALQLADRPETRFNLGIAHVRTGERELGVLQLQRAVELNPLVFHEISDAALQREVRLRLDASGYSQRHPWLFEEDPAE